MLISSNPVHLVGSIPLKTSTDVFEAVGVHMGDCCLRIPDGETGERKNWIGWQQKAFAGQAALHQTEARERDYQLHPPFDFRPGKGPSDLTFDDLGFAKAAIQSFEAFAARQDDGALPAKARLLVALPSPFAPVYSFTTYRAQRDVFPLYEAAILREVDRICAAVPAEKLAIQWDVATEMSIFEKVYEAPFDDAWEVLIDRLVKLGDHVPGDVELGYHLCYGSMNNKHWKEPDDLGLCVDVCNALHQRVQRIIDFVHMPVPIDRDDDAYFAPLGRLDLDEKTDVYLGLVHDADGLEGNRRRMATANRHLTSFGISTECGLGRREPEAVATLFDLHAKLVDEKT